MSTFLNFEFQNCAIAGGPSVGAGWVDVVFNASASEGGGCPVEKLQDDLAEHRSQENRHDIDRLMAAAARMKNAMIARREAAGEANRPSNEDGTHRVRQGSTGYGLL